MYVCILTMTIIIELPVAHGCAFIPVGLTRDAYSACRS